MPTTSATRTRRPCGDLTPQPSAARHVEHRRGVVAVGRRRTISLVPSASAAQTSARLAMLFDRARRRSASTGPIGATDRVHVASRGGHDSACTAGRKPRAIRPPRNRSAIGCVDEHHGDAAVALDHVDHLEAGDVDAELGGQREHLGGGARCGRESGCGPRPAPRGALTRLGRLVRASRGPREPVVQRARGRRGRRRRGSLASPSISSSSAARIAGRFSAQMSSQMPGWPLAMRVMSRKPPAASRSSAACSSARSAGERPSGSPR